MGRLNSKRGVGFDARIFLGIAALSLAPNLSRAMGLEEMQKADALAKVVSYAKPCGYSVDDAALEKYYETAGLDKPETFAFISNSIAMNEVGDPPSKSECTMARMTAKKLSILAK